MNFFTRLLLVAVVALFGLNGCTKSNAPASDSATAKSEVKAPAAAETTTAAQVPAAVNKVTGRWVRADGGYVLELSKPEISGVIQAGYFNPKPIKVSRAVWMQGGSGLQVAVELNDVGYPGATYVLSHDAATDRLVGQYTQPQMQQTFDVEFIRQNAPPLK